MKLYATVKSDRAEKAQGGNEYIHLYLQRERDRIEYEVEYTLDGIRLSARTDTGGIVLYDGMGKGERQKGEHDCAIDCKAEHLCKGVDCKEDNPHDC